MIFIFFNDLKNLAAAINNLRKTGRKSMGLDTECMISPICGIKNVDVIEAENRTVVIRGWGRAEGMGGEGGQRRQTCSLRCIDSGDGDSS